MWPYRHTVGTPREELYMPSHNNDSSMAPILIGVALALLLLGGWLYLRSRPRLPRTIPGVQVARGRTMTEAEAEVEAEGRRRVEAFLAAAAEEEEEEEDTIATDTLQLTPEQEAEVEEPQDEAASRHSIGTPGKE
ncbi:hypothetical protein ACFL59_09830 [Planctomycetota bacterium]